MRNYQGTRFKTKQSLFFGNEIKNPVGYLRSGGIGLSSRRNNEPNMQQLRTWPHYILVMLLENSTAVYQDEEGFTCSLAYGDFLFAFPGFKQLYGPDRGDYWAELNVGFSGALFDLYREWGVLHPSHAVWHLENPAPWIGRLREFLEAPRPNSPREIARETALFAAFLMEIMEAATPRQPDQTSNDWFTRACIMLTNDLSTKVDLHAIAEELGMGYDTFRLHFTQRAGVAPLKYRNEKRIRIACDLLRNTRKTVAEIAFYLGFRDDRHFSTFLKKHTGLSPRAHRRQNIVQI